MNYLTCVLINVPLVFVNIIANGFFIFTLVCPLHGERIKQPLKLLLETLICCTVIHLVLICMIFFSGLVAESNDLAMFSLLMSVCSLYTSMFSSVWLNFFYYTQIVPAQRPLFIWIKKNIKALMYSIWLIERIYSLSDFTVTCLNVLTLDGLGSENFTMNHDKTLAESMQWLTDFTDVLVYVLKAHFFFCLCVMLMSSGSTVVYLCKHMQHMVSNGQPLYSPTILSQVRVTVTGILQGVLYVFCAVWVTYAFFCDGTTFPGSYVDFTVINLYMSGTTFNLGVGQAVFRQRAADIWTRAAQWCKV